MATATGRASVSPRAALHHQRADLVRAAVLFCSARPSAHELTAAQVADAVALVLSRHSVRWCRERVADAYGDHQRDGWLAGEGPAARMDWARRLVRRATPTGTGESS
jgi:hypothetical protein